MDLFFDATLSMKGFVTTQTPTAYELLVPMLERSVIEGWKGGQIRFYKFGDDIVPLPGRSYLDAVKEAFYSDSRLNRRTLIERVIDKADTNSLTVIVTDLFQTNADINQLSERLKEKFLVNNLSIGVYAIRSEFAGLVYDVGPNAYSFSYKSTKADNGRPFYLLAFGKHSDVAHYFDVLETSGLNATTEKHTLIFSSHLLGRPIGFAGSKLKTADKISEISTSNLLMSGFDDDRIKAFKITNGKTAAKLGAEISYNSQLSNVIQHGSGLTVDVTAWKGEDKGGKELVLVENPQALRAFRVDAKLAPDQIPFNKIQLQANLDVTELPAAGIYEYRIVLRPDHYALPGWVANWNLSDEDVAHGHRTPSEFNGAKTYNLENFLGTLQGALLSTTPPKVGEIYCFIQVDK